jgi:hypothetical protein
MIMNNDTDSLMDIHCYPLPAAGTKRPVTHVSNDDEVQTAQKRLHVHPCSPIIRSVQLPTQSITMSGVGKSADKRRRVMV